MLNAVGKKTPCVSRFSTSGGERGTADAARDPRGFATKFFTEEGNWDWVYNNVPFFFLRDPAKFPDLIHSQKRNRATNLRDPTLFWDYVVKNQESIHMIMYLFSDYGTPRSYRHINGYMAHTHKFVIPDGTWKYIHIYLESNQGLQNLTGEEAEALAGSNPEHATEDLYDSIERGEFPSWTAYIQVIDPVDAEKYRYNIFDLTKAWPTNDIPRRPFGKLTLNRNLDDYFSENEQLAFSPSHLVPGIEPSPDPALQARMFAYPDSQCYRLGVNYHNFSANRPKNAYHPYHRDGAGFSHAQGIHSVAKVDVLTSRLPRKKETERDVDTERHERWALATAALNLTVEVSDVDFAQGRRWWRVIQEEAACGQENFVKNVSRHLWRADEYVRKEVYAMFGRIDEKCGACVERATEDLIVKG